MSPSDRAPLSAAAPGADEQFCGHCGESLGSGDHAPCRKLLELEPPRYCPQCRRRMVVQVIPRAWTATCVEHGTRHGA